ncbi:hypothetical protein, partial [Klebsiella pneumoniae]|uniref:hypothetical protein n=1 Tax=Klebsiella pneumoniae TaxID=573 RepID=UPI00371642F4
MRIGSIADVSPGLGAGDGTPAGRANTAWFDARRLSDYGLGRLELGTRGAIAIEGNLTLAHGGALDLTAPVVDIKARVT